MHSTFIGTQNNGKLVVYCIYRNENSIICGNLVSNGDGFMPDLNDFYAYKMTSSNSDSGYNKNNNSSGSSGGGSGCGTTLIVLAVIGWVLWFVESKLEG